MKISLEEKYRLIEISSKLAQEALAQKAGRDEYELPIPETIMRNICDGYELEIENPRGNIFFTLNENNKRKMTCYFEIEAYYKREGPIHNRKNNGLSKNNEFDGLVIYHLPNELRSIK